MKKLLSIGLVALGLVSTGALADTVSFQTSKHNIQVICDGGNERHADHCIYRSWNKPKKVGQGRPDLEIKEGDFQAVDLYATGYCVADNYVFRKGDLVITLGYDMKRADSGYDEKHFDRNCYPKPPPKNANGELTVYINGKKRDHYWIY